MTTFKKREPVLHTPDKEHGIVVEGSYSEKGVDSYTVKFRNGLYVCAGNDLVSTKGVIMDPPKKLCLTTGDILFADPGMAHIAAMYDTTERVKVAEEIVHRYNRYTSLMDAAKDVMKWADTPNVNNNSERTETIAKLRAVIKESEDR